jgi:hypothetical protein
VRLNSAPGNACFAWDAIMFSEISVPRMQSRQAEMTTARTSFVDLVHLVQAEYLEMPGQHLTRSQVRRLWGLDEPTCDALLGALVGVRFLRRTRSGNYVRAD